MEFGRDRWSSDVTRACSYICHYGLGLGLLFGSLEREAFISSLALSEAGMSYSDQTLE